MLIPKELGMRNGGVTHEHPRWQESRHAGARLLTVSLVMQHVQCSRLKFFFFFFCFSHSHLVFVLAFWRAILRTALDFFFFSSKGQVFTEDG